MTAGIVVAVGVGVGVTTREGVSVIVRSGVPVVDAFSVVGGPVDRAFVGEVAGVVSRLQAVRKINKHRTPTPTPASRMFGRERRAFKLAESEKNILMAATLITDYDGRKARMVPGVYQETQSRVQFNAMSVCLTMPGCDPMGSQVFSHKLLSKESLAALGIADILAVVLPTGDATSLSVILGAKLSWAGA